MSKLTKNDKAWILLFDKYNILEEINNKGFFEITSKQINEFREARLMTKFDHIANLPNIFIDNNLSILPITRGSYVIGHFSNYQKVEYNKIENNIFSFPENIESLDPLNLYSESSALHCAYITGILDDVIEEKCLPTISGRMGTGQFDFKIRNIEVHNTYNISISNSQCEIDGGFESANKLALIEAKNFSVDDFLIRQIYYPYRLWEGRMRKKVIPIFMTYSNDTFSFFIYEFINHLEYNSLKLIKQKNYIIAPEQIILKDIVDILNTTKILPEPHVPFPQADSFNRVIDLLGLLMENKVLTGEEITLNYAFDKRQTDYYTNACIYLGLVEKTRENDSINYSLTDKGIKIMLSKQKKKKLALVKCILEHEVFNKVLRKTITKNRLLNKKEVSNIMKNCYLYNIKSESTIYRRAQTVVKWIEWILSLQTY